MRFKWFLFGVLVALAAIGALAVRSFLHRPEALGRILSQALEDKLHARPAISIRDYVVVEEKKPIAELALVSRETDVEHRVESALFHSKAELSLRAVFNVKAGFDLRAARFAVDLDPRRKRARLSLPSPKVLSLEMVRYEVLADRSGWWNRISESEKELAMRSMQADAKLEAIRAGILKDCMQDLQRQLEEVSRRTGVEFEYRYRLRESDTSAAPPL